jgi:hypothetical protein
MLATVRYQIRTYRRTVEVRCSSSADDGVGLEARATRELKRRCGGVGIYPGGPCHESWLVVSREGT